MLINRETYMCSLLELIQMLTFISMEEVILKMLLKSLSQKMPKLKQILYTKLNKEVH